MTSQALTAEKKDCSRCHSFPKTKGRGVCFFCAFWLDNKARWKREARKMPDFADPSVASQY